MCEWCGEIYPKKASKNHWRFHFGAKPKALPWGSCPVNPKWMAGYGAGILAQAPAELSDLCDPAPVTAYLVNLLQVGIALPPSFRKFGVMAVWTYFIRNG